VDEEFDKAQQDGCRVIQQERGPLRARTFVLVSFEAYMATWDRVRDAERRPPVPLPSAN
jgi:hypothetical protein